VLVSPAESFLFLSFAGLVTTFYCLAALRVVQLSYPILYTLFFKNYFNIALPSVRRSPNWSLHFLSSIHSFINQWHYSTLLGPDPPLSFTISFIHMVGLLRRVISPSQGRYIDTGEHKHRINAHTDIHALCGIRTHDPRVPASEDSSYLRPRGHCDRISSSLLSKILYAYPVRGICPANHIIIFLSTSYFL
jgi:hypothetical protein